MVDNKNYVDDEINLKELFKTIFKYKYYILIFVVCVCVAAVVYVIHMKDMYTSSANMKPQNVNDNKSVTPGLSGAVVSLSGISVGREDVDSFDVLNTIIADPSFIGTFVQKNNFTSKVIVDYDKISKKKNFNDNINFFVRSSLEKTISFSHDSKTGVITLAYTNHDRFFCKKFLTALLSAISIEYRKRDLYNIKQQIEKYKVEIANTSDITLKNKLADIVSGLIQSEVVAQSHEYYGFDIITKPYVPDAIAKNGPSRSLICIMSFLTSLLCGILGALSFDYMKKHWNA